VPSLLTTDETVRRTREFVEDTLGKQPTASQDRAGFVVNALLVPFILSAIRMLKSSFATATDIDRGMVLGAAHPQGPLALVDLIGLDTTKAAAESFDAAGGSQPSPPRIAPLQLPRPGSNEDRTEEGQSSADASGLVFRRHRHATEPEGKSVAA